MKSNRIEYWLPSDHAICSGLYRHLASRYYHCSEYYFAGTSEEQAISLWVETLNRGLNGADIHLTFGDDALEIVRTRLEADEIEWVDVSNLGAEDAKAEIAWISQELQAEFIEVNEQSGAKVPGLLTTGIRTGAASYCAVLVCSGFVADHGQVAGLLGYMHSSRTKPAEPAEGNSHPAGSDTLKGPQPWSLLDRMAHGLNVPASEQTLSEAKLLAMLDAVMPFSRSWPHRREAAALIQGAETPLKGTVEAERGIDGEEAHPSTPYMASTELQADEQVGDQGNAAAGSTSIDPIVLSVLIVVSLYADLYDLHLVIEASDAEESAGMGDHAKNAPMRRFRFTYRAEDTIQNSLEQLRHPDRTPTSEEVDLEKAEGTGTSLLITCVSNRNPKQDTGDQTACRTLALSLNPLFSWIFAINQGSEQTQLSLLIPQGTTVMEESEAILSYIRTIHGWIVSSKAQTTLGELSQRMEEQLATRAVDAQAASMQQTEQMQPSEAGFAVGRTLQIMEGGATYDFGRLANDVALISQARSEKEPADRTARIAIMLESGYRYIASMISVLNTGDTYVTIDPSYPATRAQQILDGFLPDLILYDEQSSGLLEEIDRASNNGSLPARLKICALMSEMQTIGSGLQGPLTLDSQGRYVICTSGSTGMPKAIHQTSTHAANFAREYVRLLSINENSVITQIGAVAHDATIVDLYSAMLSGCTLLTFNIKKEGIDALIKELNKQCVDVLHCTPSVLREIAYQALTTGRKLEHVRAVALGGEQVMASDLILVKRLCNLPASVLNLYGSSEASFTFANLVDNSYQPVFPFVAIGLPLRGVSYQLMDSHGRQNPFMGEMVIACENKYVAISKELTRMIDDLEVGADELGNSDDYSTGDIGRRRANGMIYCLGRKDDQVKIRGFRVEIGEIDACLTRHPLVRLSATICYHEEKTGASLASFVVLDRPAASSASDPQADLRGHLVNQLPSYMVPARIILMLDLPKTASGKINRQMLTASL